MAQLDGGGVKGEEAPTPRVSNSERSIAESSPPPSRTRPRFGAELRFTGPGIRNLALTDSSGQVSRLYTIRLGGAFLPRLPDSLRRFGVLGVTLDLGFHPVFLESGKQSGVTFAMDQTLRATYQGQWMNQQFLVPTLSYGPGFWSFRERTGGAGWLFAHHLSFGFEFLLNALDGKAADRIYDDYGVARTLLVIDATWNFGTSDAGRLSARSLYAGFRFEM